MLNTKQNQMDINTNSNKEISLREILNPRTDLAGYINGQTAESIGINPQFYSVWGHYNNGNTVQLLIPIEAGKTPYIKLLRPDDNYNINYRLATGDEMHSLLNGLNSTDLNIDTLKTSGTYSFDPNTLGTFPGNKGYGLVFVRTANNGNWVFQDLIYTASDSLAHYMRKNINNEGWSSWYEYATK